MKANRDVALLLNALENLVGPGAQHEHTCDRAEHDEDSACIYCEARTALATVQERQKRKAGT